MIHLLLLTAKVKQLQPMTLLLHTNATAPTTLRQRVRILTHARTSLCKSCRSYRCKRRIFAVNSSNGPRIRELRLSSTSPAAAHQSAWPSRCMLPLWHHCPHSSSRTLLPLPPDSVCIIPASGAAPRLRTECGWTERLYCSHSVTPRCAHQRMHGASKAGRRYSSLRS